MVTSYHAIVSSVKISIKINASDIKLWNDFRGKHAILVRYEQVEELKEDISIGDIRGALFSKLTSEGLMSSHYSLYKTWFK
ncbi:MAG: hypothetical protein ACTSSJ_04075 [Candidatus Odinarchaeia archaeon]